jgi:hypothetical protein
MQQEKKRNKTRRERRVCHQSGTHRKASGVTDQHDGLEGLFTPAETLETGLHSCQYGFRNV